MTVRDLIDELENYDEDMEVVFRGSNAMYVETIGTTGTNEIKCDNTSDSEEDKPIG